MINNKVLIVDDNINNAVLLLEILYTKNIFSETALSGNKALEKIQENIPDLILLDVMMPGIDGFELCSMIKFNPETSHIPVIFVSAAMNKDYVIKAMEMGAVDYITKPYNEIEIALRVGVHLNIVNKSRIIETQNINLKRAEESFTLMYNSINDGVIILDLE